MGGLRGLVRHVFETVTRRLDLGLRSSVTARPHLGGRGRELGDIIPNDGTRGAVNESGALRGFSVRNQPNANDNDASPT